MGWGARGGEFRRESLRAVKGPSGWKGVGDAGSALVRRVGSQRGSGIGPSCVYLVRAVCVWGLRCSRGHQNFRCRRKCWKGPVCCPARQPPAPVALEPRLQMNLMEETSGVLRCYSSGLGCRSPVWPCAALLDPRQRGQNAEGPECRQEDRAAVGPRSPGRV